jgi:hypothetical protein
MMFETIHARDLGPQPIPGAQPKKKLRLYGEAELTSSGKAVTNTIVLVAALPRILTENKSPTFP